MRYPGLIQELKMNRIEPSVILVRIPTFDGVDYDILTFRVSSHRVGGTRRGKEWMRLHKFLTQYPSYTWDPLGYHPKEHRFYYAVTCEPQDLPF